ncbi:hypothetical protein DDT46_22515 [Mycobacteroides abscessus]|uniref:hypothetical protein n=1 Tax=Mycobacteroides abscessus TaxID=36809 RepID=UPI000C25A631|nr:hypothetical protein [Mycobacteroides abscessus]AWG66287.1 hypothetical protein DDT46_22515 [Mycobacteroides abscessus]
MLTTSLGVFTTELPGEVLILAFEEVDTSTSGNHSYTCYDLVSDDDLIAEVAAIVRDLYVDDLALQSSLRTAAQGLDDVCDEAAIAAAIDTIAEAVIPQVDREAKQPVHLQAPRNEVAEVLALYVLEHIHGFEVPASRIRNKEVPGLPSRGLDVLGLTSGHAAVLTEVKASSATASPPPVVHTASDSMLAETLKRLNNRKSLIAELHWALKHAKEESRDHVGQAVLLYALPDAPVPQVAPVLVRAAGTYKVTDYGKFQSPGTEFGESPIRFVVVRLPGALEDFAELVYAKAAEQVA